MHPTLNATSGLPHLKQALERAGFYPPLVLDVVIDAVDGREVLSDLVHLETHFDRTEVHRHITVLVLTEDMLVVAHVDDQQLDESGEQIVAHVSTESVPLNQVSSVVLSYAFAQPQQYTSTDQPRELTLSIAWSGAQRLDMLPAGCADPACDADHGYTGNAAREDITLRISAEADGADAVGRAKMFARALRSANTVMAPPPAHPAPVPRPASIASRLRTHSSRSSN